MNILEGQKLIKNKEYAKALTFFLNLKKKNIKNKSIYFYLGLIYFEFNKFNKSIFYYNKYLKKKSLIFSILNTTPDSFSDGGENLNFKHNCDKAVQMIKNGADFVVHSLTKWMAGHGSSMAGILVEGGKFDFLKTDKFPTMTEPYEGYHGLSFAEEFGPVAFTMKARAEGMRDFGPCLSPQNAWNVLQGIETLSVRMKKHC